MELVGEGNTMTREPLGESPVYVSAPVSSIEQELRRLDTRLSVRLDRIDERLSGLEQSVWKQTWIIIAGLGVATPVVVLAINWLLNQ